MRDSIQVSNNIKLTYSYKYVEEIGEYEKTIIVRYEEVENEFIGEYATYNGEAISASTVYPTDGGSEQRPVKRVSNSQLQTNVI